MEAQSKYQKILYHICGNEQNKNKQISNMQIKSQKLLTNKHSLYLGIEMTSSGSYAYPREILSKKAAKNVSTVKWLLSYIDPSAVH